MKLMYAGVDVHQWETRQEVADIMDIISHCVKNKSNMVGVAAKDILILFLVHFAECLVITVNYNH